MTSIQTNLYIKSIDNNTDDLEGWENRYGSILERIKTEPNTNDEMLDEDRLGKKELVSVLGKKEKKWCRCKVMFVPCQNGKLVWWYIWG